MGRQILPLTVERLPLLIEPCSTCVFWERTPARSSRPAPDRLAVKRDWLRTVVQEWGSPGRVALVDDTPAGYVTYAPAHLIPRALAFPTAPVSDDAVALVTARIAGQYAGQGLGRMLVQYAAKDVLRHGVRAIEVFATTAPRRLQRVPLPSAAQGVPSAPDSDTRAAEAVNGGSEVAPPGHNDMPSEASIQVSVAAGRPGGEPPTGPDLGDTGRRERPQGTGRTGSEYLRQESEPRPSDVWGRHQCLLPVDFLAAVGFHLVREHPLYPRMRLELRTALHWREELGLAVERLFTPVRSLGGRRPVGTVN